MSFRFFLHIPKRTAQIILYSLLVGIVVFIAMTRTRVGRDELRSQMEIQFNNTFVGNIQIEGLEGNLLNTLYARNILFLDSTGANVAKIDAAILEPSWLDLFRRTIAMRRITLIKPTLHLAQRPDSTWRIQDVFRRKDGRPPQLLFNSSDIRVIDGRVSISPLADENAPADSAGLFHFSGRTLTDIRSRLNVEILQGEQLFDIQQTSFSLPDQDVRVSELHGQVVTGQGRIELNQFYIETEATRLALSASMNNLDSLSNSPASTLLDLHIRDSIIDQDALRRLFPNLPVADTIFVAAQMRGPFNALNIPSIQLAHGDLAIDAAGSISGYPDSLRIDFDFSNSSFSRPDLQRIAPSLDVSFLGTSDPIRLHTLRGRGNLLLPDPMEDASPLLQRTTYGEVLFDVSSASGAMRGNAELFTDRQDSLHHFHSSITVDSLNLATLLHDVTLPTYLNGTVGIEGSGTVLREASTDIRLRMSSSMVGNHPIDTLHSYVFVDPSIATLSGYATHTAYGELQTEASLRRDRPDRPIVASLAMTDVDIGRILRQDSLHTALTGGIDINVTGTTFSSLRGAARIDLDSSDVTHGSISRTLPPHATAFSLYDTERGTQRFLLQGDAASIQVEGVLESQLLTAFSNLWSAALTETLAQTAGKEYPHTGSLIPAEAQEGTTTQLTTSTPDIGQLVEEARQQMVQKSMRDFPSLQASFEIFRGDLIYPWFKNMQPLSAYVTGSAALTSEFETLIFTARLLADSLQYGGVRLDQLTGQVDAAVDRNKAIRDQISLDARVQADSLHFIGQVFPLPIFTAHLENSYGTLELLTKGSRRVGPQRLRGQLALLEDKNRFHINDVFLSIGNSFWAIEKPTFVDLYKQTLVIPEFSLQSKSAEANILQQISFSGVVSPYSEDPTSVRIDNIALRPISQFLNTKDPIGGLLNGQLEFTLTNKQPEVTGAINIDRLTFDDRVLGNVMMSSSFLQGEPDVGLRVELSPVPENNRDQFLPDAILPARYEENALTLEGVFRLPRFSQESSGLIDAGTIDLDLTMDRADVFFFEYIFPNLLERTDGFLSGKGTIAGDFSYPIFDLGLRLDEGDLYIPKFNIRYTDFSGPLDIDDEGIKLRDMTFRDPTGGEAKISGAILFNEYRFFSFDLESELDEIQIMNQSFSNDLPFYGKIWGSGTLTLTGPTTNAFLFTQNGVTKASSELFIPVTEDEFVYDEGFIIFADSAGNIPDFKELTYRKNLLSKRPEGERKFIDGLSMNLNIDVPTGSSLHLVFDPLLGDVINAVSSGNMQLLKSEGEFTTFGRLSVDSGDYLFTAGDVFARRFLFDRGGTITWDGSPVDARLNIPASYRTRASPAGLPGNPFDEDTPIPLIVRLDITGRVSSPEVQLSLETDRSDRAYNSSYETIDAFLNQAELTTDFATSVMLTNSFLLTTESNPDTGQLTDSGEQIAFSSVSQLVASQLNRFLNEAIPNVDFNLGLQGESLDAPDVTYGVALYLLNERLVIRGQGIYQNDLEANQPGLEGEFEVEVRLNPNISVSVFLRQEGDILAENALSRARGAGLSYQTQFSSWNRFFNRLFGWIGRKKDPPPPATVAEGPTQENE